jgi:hypothetical protein
MKLLKVAITADIVLPYYYNQKQPPYETKALSNFIFYFGSFTNRVEFKT